MAQEFDIFGMLIGTIGLVATIISSFFAYWQYKERIKVENLWLDEIRNIWDISSSYSVDTSKLLSYYNDIVDKKIVIHRLTKSNTALNILTRNIVPIYVRLLGKKMDYKLIKCMIIANEINTVYLLKIFLQNLPIEYRKIEEEENLYQLLTKSVARAEDTINETKQKKNQGFQTRNILYENSKQ